MRIHRVGRILKLVHLPSPEAQNHHKSTQNSNMRENNEVDLHSGVIAAGKTIKPQSIYSSSKGFWPIGSKSVLYKDFLKMIFWLVLKLEISYRVMISGRILVSSRGIF